MSFADCYKKLISDKGFSAKQISRVSGVSESYLSMLFRGKIKEPSWEKALVLVGAIGMTMEEFSDLIHTDSCKEKPSKSENAYRNRVSEARKKAGLSQIQAAEALGMTQQGYQYYEYTKRDIKASLLKKMASVFHCSVMFLLGMDDEDIEMPESDVVNGIEGRSEFQPDLSEPEKNLVESFRSLDSAAQQMVLTIVEDMCLSKRHEAK